jgi:Flagellar biosynthesis protein, FliO
MMLAASTAELTLRMAVSLALMGLVALVAMKFLRGRLGLGAGRAGLAVQTRQQLSRGASVAVIRAGERHFLVGVTETTVTLLAEGDDLISAVGGAVGAGAGAGTAALQAEAAGGGARAGLGFLPNSAPGRRTRVGSGGRNAQVRHRGADGTPIDGAGKRHRRAAGPPTSGKSVIEALREKTVRR